MIHHEFICAGVVPDEAVEKSLCGGDSGIGLAGRPEATFAEGLCTLIGFQKPYECASLKYNKLTVKEMAD